MPRVDLQEDLPRGHYPGHVGTPPQACFESPENLVATESLRIDLNNNPENKLYLGIVQGDVVQEGRLRDGRVNRYVVGGTPLGLSDDRHGILWAGSRGHKFRAGFAPKLLALASGKNSIYIHDPKGEFARACAQYLAEVIGRLVCVLDPFGVSGPTTQAYRVCLNHLMMMDPYDKYSFMTKCKLLANALIIDELGTKEPHWNQTAEQAITFLIGHVRTYERYEGMRDLTTVALLTSMLGMRDPSDPSKYLLEVELQSNTAGGGMIAYLARQFFSRTGGEFSSVISNTGKNLEWLMLEPIQECVSGPSIDLRDFVRGSMILIDCRPVLTVGDLRGWTRMQVQMLLAAHEEYAVLPGHRNFFFLDEFLSLGRLKVLETSAAYLAGFGAQLLVAIQDISQLRANFPHSWETFLANAGFIQAFSIADNASLEYLSKAMGEAATLSRSTNAPSFDQATQQAATGESWSLGSHRLMTPDEIGRFFGRDDAKLRQLILRPGYRPAILQRAFYDKHPLFAGKFQHE